MSDQPAVTLETLQATLESTERVLVDAQKEVERLTKELELRVDSAKELRDHLRDCNMMDFRHKKELAHYKTTAEREAFLHDLDHKLADQWQARVGAAGELHLADETTIRQLTRSRNAMVEEAWRFLSDQWDALANLPTNDGIIKIQNGIAMRVAKLVNLAKELGIVLTEKANHE